MSTEAVTPAKWRKQVLAAMTRHNDVMRNLIGGTWRPPGWVTYHGVAIPKPETDIEVLDRSARTLRQESTRLERLAYACEQQSRRLQRGLTHSADEVRKEALR